MSAALIGSADASASAPVAGRAWELITPSEPVSALMHDVLAVRDDGRRVIYLSLGPLPGAASGDLLSRNLAVRTASGWRTEPMGGVPFLSRELNLEWVFGLLFGPYLVGYNSDLSGAVLASIVPILPGAPPEPTLGAYRWKEGGDLSFVGSIGDDLTVRGVSSDLERIVFSAREHFLTGDAGRTSGESIYEYDGTSLKQVDLDSNGSLLSACGSEVPEAGISSSAGRAYLINPRAGEPCDVASRIFLREGGSTTEVSASRCTEDCGDDQAESFAGATPTGSVAFFSTVQRLVNADQNQKRDLYRFTATDKGIELVSPGSAGMEGEVATGSVAASADGSVVYFYSQGPLLPGQGGPDRNLYVADSNGIRFITPIRSGDPLKVSSDGDVAAFSTVLPVDAGDTDTNVDAYVYDRRVGALSIASQGPAGGNGAFDVDIAPHVPFVSDPQNRHVLAVDGSRLFFNTAESLVPEDTNGAVDAYEWTSAGLALISSGRFGEGAKFVSADSTGQTVVIRTAEALLPSDRDGGDIDFYAARPGGGFDESEEVPPPACVSCRQGHPSGPARPAAASESDDPRESGQLRLGRLGPGACAGLLQDGELTLVALVARAGRVTAVATDTSAAGPQVLMRGAAEADAAGKVRLRLVAKAPARRALRRRGEIQLRVVLRQGGAVLSRLVTLRCGRRR